MASSVSSYSGWRRIKPSSSRLHPTRLRGVELDRLNKWLGHIKDVTTDDVLDVANKYIHPEDFIIVVVGDASEIQAQLETLGEVTLLEAE